MGEAAVKIHEREGKICVEKELQDIHHAFLFGVGGLLRLVRDGARYSHDLSQTAADIAEVCDLHISVVENLSLRLEAAISEVIK
ncbi:MAG: hypothetical protein EOM03_14790 [Clostridia bacterium]|nr:hypothetical protein [Clostridia bacterium]